MTEAPAAPTAAAAAGRPAVLITGATGGIGHAVALEFARTHNIIAVDRDENRLAVLETETAEHGARTLTQAADITDESAMNNLIAEAENLFGPLHAAVACAGIAPSGTVETTTLQDWQTVLAVNLTGAFVTARATISSLKKTRGSFIAIASDAGTTGAQDLAAYVASKHGVVGLIRSMALDFGPYGVRSNAICPGFVDTGMMKQIFEASPEGTEDYYRNTVPLARFAQPREIATIARHLTESTYANGMTYAVDGGSTAGYFQHQPQ